MKTVNRSYSEEKGDFKRISEFFIQEHEHLRTHSTWSLARFVDWKYGLYRSRTSIAGFWEQNAQLWFDGFDKLAGIAISEEGNSGFAILTSSGYRVLFEEILDWVLQYWNNRESQYAIEMTEYQHNEAEILERVQFTKQSTCFTRCVDLTVDLPAHSPLEKGFEIIDMASHPEYRAQRILRADAFGGMANISEEELTYQLQFYNYTHHSPIYHPATDLCVKATDGRHVAGCEALIDAWNCVADLERICTHHEFRRRGFARAVIQECLSRLQAMGLKKAYILGYSPEAISLYGSLGAKEELTSWTYIRSS